MWPILVGYNLPFVCWTAYAVWRAMGGTGVGFCPNCHLFGWCPGCGATTAYAHFIATGQPPGVFVDALLLGFLLMAGVSVHKAWRISRAG